jgi:putative hemolysin
MNFVSTILFDFFVILFLIIWSGFYSAAEIAIISVRKSRLQELAEQNNKKAKIIQDLLENHDDFFAIVQIGMTVLPSLASALAGVIAVTHIKPLFEIANIPWISSYAESISFFIVVAIISYLIIIIGELVPKSLGAMYPETLSLFFAKFILWQLKFLHHIIKFLSTSTSLIVKPLSKNRPTQNNDISEDEFKLMLEEGTKSGVIDKTEHDLISSIFQFTDTTAKEVMIPRTRVVAINGEASQEDILKILLEEGYSRLPVYRETIDNIVGIIYAKDLISLLENKNLIILEDILRPAYFVPDTKKISQIMKDFQTKKNHMAIVLDEFGGFEGIVTMEDILEEIVGEINDEYDEETKPFEISPTGGLAVDGMLNVSDFNEKFDSFEIPEDEDYDTVGGFVIKCAGRIPEINERIIYQDTIFTILKKDERRISLIKIEKSLTEPTEPTEQIDTLS